MSQPSPSLPPDLEERLLSILDGPDTERDVALAELRSAAPDHGEALDSWLDSYAAIRAPEGETLPETIGNYRIVSRLGSGSFGTVYAAERHHPVDQRVAIKVVKRGMATAEVLARFAVERNALAAMSHRSIARVFDAGETEAGQPYFVMELVEGQPLNRSCDEQQLSLDARLAVFLEICAGVQHAHQKGIVHRDLKPANVLVTSTGGDHEPKILDFGLAKATLGRAPGDGPRTEEQRVLGTLEYMSPEQARGDSTAIDARTDVYSLGVMLYELLTGLLPFPSDELRKLGTVRALLRIQDEEPLKPSAALRAAPQRVVRSAELRGLSPASLRRSLRGDLDWIVMRALAKDPEARYASADALAMDLRRHLDSEPVHAGPPGAGYRLRKLLRRHRSQAAATAVVTLTLIAAGLISWLQLLETRRAKSDLEISQSALQSRNRQYEQLATVVLLDRVEDAVTQPPVAWPENLVQLRAAADAWDLLERDLPALRQTLQSMQQEAAGWRQDGPTRIDEGRRFLFDQLTRVTRRVPAVRQSAELRRLRETDLVWAESLAWRTADPEHRRRWREAEQQVAALPAYAPGGPTQLRSQYGLVPIGTRGGLLEFYHLRSAWDGKVDPRSIPLPERRADGELRIDEDSGIVFVLIPGGEHLIGAQQDDPTAPHYDPRATTLEDAPQRVALSPFLLARHELTVGQWNRLRFGDLPRRPDRYSDDLARPVTEVSWRQCQPLLQRHGLTLPTEAQWETGCRARTATPWWPGADPDLLTGHIHRGDDIEAVDRRSANPWGLLQVHGNVAEWCLDLWSRGPAQFASVDGERLASESIGERVVRGGCDRRGDDFVRSSFRTSTPLDTRAPWLGLRAARALHQ